MSVFDLITRYEFETCHTSLNLLICGERHCDNTHFWERHWTELRGAPNLAVYQFFSEYTFMKTKENAFWTEFYPLSPMFFCEQKRGEERWKKIDTYTESPQNSVQDVSYHGFDTNKNWRCWIENQISRHCGWNFTLDIPWTPEPISHLQVLSN